MQFFLGIDGGGTGCRAILVGDSGQILGRGQAGPANIVTDPDGARANIIRAAELAIEGSGARLQMLHAGLGLAGANVPEFSAQLRAALPFASTRIKSDAVTALKGALGDQDGVAAILGTGSVFAGQSAGQVTQIGGWGLALGDEGSGAWLGRALAGHALRAVDGLEPMTPLLEALLGEHGGPAGLVTFARTARPVAYGGLAPRLFDTADPAAEAVLAEAEAWILRGIDFLAGDRDTAVTFLGGLGPRFAERLAPRYGARIIAPKGTALDGALWLARQDGPDI